jgi:hypothetical protein
LLIGIVHDGRREPLSQPPSRRGKPVRTLTLKGKREPFREMAEEPTPAIPGEEALLLASAVAGGAHWL